MKLSNNLLMTKLKESDEELNKLREFAKEKFEIE